MKKKPSSSRKRLSITKSTLRRLNKDQLSRVGGGERDASIIQVPHDDSIMGCGTNSSI